MLFRLVYLSVTGVFGLLRLLPVSAAFMLALVGVATSYVIGA